MSEWLADKRHLIVSGLLADESAGLKRLIDPWVEGHGGVVSIGAEALREYQARALEEVLQRVELLSMIHEVDAVIEAMIREARA